MHRLWKVQTMPFEEKSKHANSSTQPLSDGWYFWSFLEQVLPILKFWYCFESRRLPTVSLFYCLWLDIVRDDSQSVQDFANCHSRTIETNRKLLLFKSTDSSYERLQDLRRWICDWTKNNETNDELETLTWHPRKDPTDYFLTALRQNLRQQV